MATDGRWALRAGSRFGAAAAGLALAWYLVGTYTSSLETLRDGVSAADLAVYSARDLLAFVGPAAVGGGVVGLATWWLFVERVDRWSVPGRGALTGAFTGWATLGVAGAAIAANAAGPGDSLPATAVVGFVAGLGPGTVLVGWSTVPLGALVGYALGLGRAGERPLVDRVRAGLTDT